VGKWKHLPLSIIQGRQSDFLICHLQITSFPLLNTFKYSGRLITSPSKRSSPIEKSLWRR
jgi:hypothetical protein